jgi:hypothetical protein
LSQYIDIGAYKFDAFKPDFQAFPDLCKAEMHEAILEEGEYMYIPNTAAHGVVNLEHTIAVTSNLFHPLDKSQKTWLTSVCDEGLLSDITCWWMEEHIARRQAMHVTPHLDQHGNYDSMKRLNNYPDYHRDIVARYEMLFGPEDQASASAEGVEAHQKETDRTAANAAKAEHTEL